MGVGAVPPTSSTLSLRTGQRLNGIAGLKSGTGVNQSLLSDFFQTAFHALKRTPYIFYSSCDAEVHNRVAATKTRIGAPGVTRHQKRKDGNNSTSNDNKSRERKRFTINVSQQQQLLPQKKARPYVQCVYV